MLTTQQLRSLHQGLLNAFDPAGFEELVFRVGAPLDRLVAHGTPLSGQVLEVVQAAERAGWTHELVRAAYEARPGDQVLADISQELGLAIPISFQHAGTEIAESPALSTSAGLEHVISPSQGLIDIGLWRERLTAIEARVCRVELGGGRIMGTGFLVGPDTILTCYHVVADAIGDASTAETIRVRFDYRVLTSGVTEGVVFRLHPGEWLADASAYSPGEGDGDPLPTTDELDYALLRLERPVGLNPMDAANGGGPPRGWLQVPEGPSNLVPGMPLSIAQYARGGPLKIAMDSNAVIGLNENGTRVRYRATTEPGSAGAPCFDAEWELVAMHQGHSGPNPDPTYKKGIPIAAIRDRLKRMGKEDALGGAPPGPAPDERVGSASPPTPGPVVDPEDPQRARWGGAAEESGRKVTAKIREVLRTSFTFDVSVSSTDGSPLRSPVVFHLHDSYPKSVVWIRRLQGGEAVLWEVDSYGVYTVGVQVKDAGGNWIGLELDLATLEGLPERFLKQ